MRNDKGTGRLHVICGPMYAGKTTALLHNFYKLRSGGRAPTIVKPAFDDRYGVETVSSHDGLKAAAYPVQSYADIATILATNRVGHLLVDECQFFSEDRYHTHEDFPRDLSRILESGIDVTCVGLDCDWRGMPFRVTADLLAMADTVTKLTAFCAVCGEAASKTGKIAGSDSSVELGGHDAYEARCLAHWAPRKLARICEAVEEEKEPALS